LLCACKKGEDDPFISLATRKSRVEGEWRLEKADVTVGIKDSTGFYGSLIYEITADKYNQRVTGTGMAFNGSAALSLSFTQDGLFTLKQTMDSLSLTASGTWDFYGKVGESKNKESISMHLNTAKGNTNQFSFFNKSFFQFNYKIKELRSKKIVLVCDKEMILLDSGYGVYVTSEYVFVQ
jgi:hypothetical protein